MTVQLSHPEGLLEQSDYAPLSIATGSRLLLLAGQTASAVDGTVVADDLAGQVQASLHNVLVAVRSAGGGAADIARLTCYVVDWTLEKWKDVLEGASKIQTAEGLALPMPPITIIGVQALFRPEILVEIEATAVLE